MDQAGRVELMVKKAKDDRERILKAAIKNVGQLISCAQQTKKLLEANLQAEEDMYRPAGLLEMKAYQAVEATKKAEARNDTLIALLFIERE